jgi:ribosomal peptide maturation radical SAM protein 1
MPDVVIVVPPFASVQYPMLGPSLLAAACRRVGVSADVDYANVGFAVRVGFARYDRMALSSLHVMAADAVFAGERARRAVDRWFASRDAVAVSDPMSEPLSHDDFLACARAAHASVRDTARRILALGPAIVGFSSTFQQNLASIAVAREIKRARPGVVTVLGGANASSPMGAALRRAYPVFDFVFSGEADDAFPAFCRDYLRDGVLPAQPVVECAPLAELDTTPVPDFSAYFASIEDARRDGDPLASELPSALPVETSRGCWWGAKKHCTFCGLNGKEIGYRAKSVDRIVSEFDELVARHGIRKLQATDNIMPLSFRTGVLPALAAKDEPLELFYEVKSNLKDADLDLFVRAGVTTIQPGIESLSSHVLRLMDKGVSALQNLWLLRECTSRQIEVVWNMLIGIPGERLADYAAMLELIPDIEHLYPPRTCSPIVIDRYSPYHDDPTRYGIASIAPFRSYRYLYRADADLDAIGYHFTGDYTTELLAAHAARARFQRVLDAWLAKWTVSGTPPKLFAVPIDQERLFVEDTRASSTEHRLALSAPASAALRALSKPQRADDMADDVRAALPELVSRRFVTCHEGLWISVVTTPETGFRLRLETHERRLGATSTAQTSSDGKYERSVPSRRMSVVQQ